MAINAAVRHHGIDKFVYAPTDSEMEFFKKCPVHFSFIFPATQPIRKLRWLHTFMSSVLLLLHTCTLYLTRTAPSMAWFGFLIQDGPKVVQKTVEVVDDRQQTVRRYGQPKGAWAPR